ncbi:hypothetical protein [uncultured Acetobacteroides sp.]|uniref:hypothetical protein n=1 Tax=uncultured Acetobacteroides sp. TaxID=1760811 RepID=UPI0029F4A13A|nr:hypothetical protein [uncultured Acetobacteroides sp.]
MNGYELSRRYWDWAFENPDKNNPTLVALYFYIIEVANRLGWKERFSITPKECCEAIGVSSYKTYKKNFDLLVEYEFIAIVKKSFNQHQANIIALVNSTKAHTNALTKAVANANPPQVTEHIPHSINLETENIKPLNIEKGFQPLASKDYKKILFKEVKIEDIEESDVESYNIAKGFYDLFYKNMLSSGIQPTSLEKAKYETVITPIRLMLQREECTKDDLRTIFEFLEIDEFWKLNIRSTAKLREKRETLLMQAKAKRATNEKQLSETQKHIMQRAQECDRKFLAAQVQTRNSSERVGQGGKDYSKPL